MVVGTSLFYAIGGCGGYVGVGDGVGGGSVAVVVVVLVVLIVVVVVFAVVRLETVVRWFSSPIVLLIVTKLVNV